MGALHLTAHTVRDLHIAADAFTCWVLLNPHDRQPWSPVRVPFAQVWQVVWGDSPRIDLEAAEAAGDLLYDAPEVLSSYARPAVP